MDEANLSRRDHTAMSDALTAMTAHAAISDLDQANRDFAPAAWSDGAGSSFPLNKSLPAHAANDYPDEWEILNRDGWFQHPTTGMLRHLPVAIYPGLILDDMAIEPVKAPANRRLWIVIEHTLGSVTYPDRESPGWNGQITDTRARFEWDALGSTAESRPHAYFPGSYDSSMPPNNTFIINISAGTTDASGRFTGSITGGGSTCGQLIPNY